MQSRKRGSRKAREVKKRHAKISEDAKQEKQGGGRERYADMPEDAKQEKESEQNSSVPLNHQSSHPSISPVQQSVPSLSSNSRGRGEKNQAE